MKKRIFSLILALAMLCAMLPQAALTARAETRSDSCAASPADPLGESFTVTFSVLGDVGVIAPMVCDPQTGITLPTAEGPQGYRFLGWVLEECVNAAEQPETVLTGEYFATGDVTLLALFTYNDYNGNPPSLTQMSVGDTFSDGDKIVISESTGTYGLYQKSHNYAYVSNFAFTEDPEEILADELKYFDVTQVEGGWYLGDEVNGWLYTPDNQTNLTIRYNTAFMTAFTLTTYEGHLALQHTVSYNDNVFYVNCGTNLSGALTNKWRMVNANNMSGISMLNIYKLNEGGPALARYTTTLHTHTPGEPVEENSAAATCTEPGGYDTVVYCTGCGAELSRVHTDVPALGHDFGDWGETTPPSCTEAGEETRECSRCDAVETRPVEALGHDFGDWDETTPPSCTEAGEENRECSRCDAVETRPVEALGHDLVHHEAKPATCTEAGWDTYDTCTRCDYTSYEEIPAPGHDWNEGEVTVAATHQAVGEMRYTCARCQAERKEEIAKLPNPFVDVLDGDYFFDPVMWALDHQVTAGVDDTHFGPNNDCTREQIVTFLWAANGKPEPAGTESPFSDVASDAWYYKPVMWAVEHGYTSGMGDGSFGVGQACTRAQAMTFLWASKGKPAPSSMESPFGDVSSGDWFCKPILWAAENGITKGIGNGLFGVNHTCTRAQIITFLYKAYK
jgi:hypothetical protein